MQSGDTGGRCKEVGSVIASVSIDCVTHESGSGSGGCEVHLEGEAARSPTSKGICTNTLYGGFGPQHCPSGLGCITHPLSLSFSSPASDGAYPAPLEEVCFPNELSYLAAVQGEVDSACGGSEGSSYVDLGFPNMVQIDSVWLEDAPSFDSNGSIEVDSAAGYYVRPCPLGSCSGVHELEGVPIQLNPCAFYDECFSNLSGRDPNADYIFTGVRDGFKIVDDTFGGSYACNNYSSILDPEFRSQMDNNIEAELIRGKVSVVSDPPTCIRAMGAIRKSNGKLRPITDCRCPEGESINNFMSTTCKEFTFLKLDEVADYMEHSCWFAVLDLQAAYRSVHIFPQHRTFQGFVWDVNGLPGYLTDNCLSFGLRCAPYIFSRLTEFVVRGMLRRGYHGIFGYLDDFLVVADSEDLCRDKLHGLIRFVRSLGFDVAWDKLISPTQVATYLGIEMDSINMQFRLPGKKLVKLKSLVAKYKSASHATKRELQVLAGHLAHASTVVRGGRTFSRRLLNLVKYLPDSPRRVTLPEWFKPDLVWWAKLMDTFNGSAKVIRSQTTLEGHISTDSSMSGFGGVWAGDWFVGTWVDPLTHRTEGVPDHHLVSSPESYTPSININILELWPVIVAAQRWGRYWQGKKVHFLTDNTQVLQMINTGRSASIECMFWIRELFWLSFIYNFHAVASHIGTQDNIVPDHLSRCYDPKYKSFPQFDLIGHLCCFQSWPLSTQH